MLGGYRRRSFLYFLKLCLYIGSLVSLYPTSLVYSIELPRCDININKTFAPNIYFDFKHISKDNVLTLDELKKEYGESFIALPNENNGSAFFRPLKYNGSNINISEFSIVDFNRGDTFICNVNKLQNCKETSSDSDYLSKQQNFIDIEDRVFNICETDMIGDGEENNVQNETNTAKTKACLNQDTGEIVCNTDCNSINDNGKKDIRELSCSNGTCSPNDKFIITVSNNQYFVEQIKNCFPKNHICYFYKKDIDLYSMIDRNVFDSTVRENKSFYIYEKNAIYGNSKNEIANNTKANCIYDLFKCDFNIKNESTVSGEKNVVYVDSSISSNRKFIDNITAGLGNMAFFRFLGTCNYNDSDCKDKIKATNYYKYINQTTKTVYYFDKNFRSQKGVICDGYLPNCKDVLLPLALYNNVVGSDDNNREARENFYKNQDKTFSASQIQSINEANMWFINSNNFADSNCLSMEGEVKKKIVNGKEETIANYSYKGYCSDLTEDQNNLVYPNGFKNNNCYFKSCIDLTTKEIEVIGAKGGAGKFCSEYTWLNSKYGFKYFPKEKPVFCNETVNGKFKFPQGFEVDNPKCYLKNCFSIKNDEERNLIVYSRYKYFLNKTAWVYNLGNYADGEEHSFNDYYYSPKYCYRGLFFDKNTTGFENFSEINFNVNFCNDFSNEQISAMSGQNRFIGLFSEFFNDKYNSDNRSYFCRTHIVPFSNQKETDEFPFLKNTLIGLDERKTENIRDSYIALYNSIFSGKYANENLYSSNSQHNINLKIDNNSDYGKIRTDLIGDNSEIYTMANYCHTVDNSLLYQDTAINNLSHIYYLDSQKENKMITFDDTDNSGNFIINNDSGLGDYLAYTHSITNEDKSAIIDTETITYEECIERKKNGNYSGIKDICDSILSSGKKNYYEVLVNRIKNKAIKYNECIGNEEESDTNDDGQESNEQEESDTNDDGQESNEQKCRNSNIDEQKYYDIENIIFQNLIDCSVYNSDYNMNVGSVSSYFDCDLYNKNGEPYDSIKQHFTTLYPIHSSDDSTNKQFIRLINERCNSTFTQPEELNSVVDKANLTDSETISALVRPYISKNTKSNYLNNFSQFNFAFKNSATTATRVNYNASNRGMAGCAEYKKSSSTGLRQPREDSLYFLYDGQMIHNTTNKGAIISAIKRYVNKDFKYKLKMCLRGNKEQDACGQREDSSISDKCIDVTTGNYIDIIGYFNSVNNLSAITDTYYSSIQVGNRTYFIQRVRTNSNMTATDSVPYIDWEAVEKLTTVLGDTLFITTYIGTYFPLLIEASVECAIKAIAGNGCNPVIVADKRAKFAGAKIVYYTILLPHKSKWYIEYEGGLHYPYNYLRDEDIENVDEGFLSKITLPNNDNYYYNYYPRSSNIVEDIMNQLLYNRDLNGNRFFHRTTRSYDILKHCGMSDMLIDKNGCLNSEKQHPISKYRQVTDIDGDDFVLMIGDKIQRLFCAIIKGLGADITCSSVFDLGGKQEDCNFKIKDYNTGGECSSSDYYKCLTKKQKQCLDSFGVRFLDMNQLVDPRYKDYENSSIFKRHKNGSRVGSWLEGIGQAFISPISYFLPNDPADLYQLPTNIIKLAKYNGKEEDLINNPNCKLNKYGNPIGNLAKCRVVSYDYSNNYFISKDGKKYSLLEYYADNNVSDDDITSILPTTIKLGTNVYTTDETNDDKHDIGTAFTESQSVPNPLLSSPPLFFNLVTPNNIPEIFSPILFLIRFRNSNNELKYTAYTAYSDNTILDFFNPQMHFLYDYQQINDEDLENQYSAQYEKNGDTTRHIIEQNKQYSNPYLLKYKSIKVDEKLQRFILEKKYDGDFTKTYSPTVCLHWTILANDDGANRCLSETIAPTVGSIATLISKESVKLCGIGENPFTCGNYDDYYESDGEKNNSGKCVSVAFSDYYCYSRKIPDLKTNLVIKQDSDINYLFPVINAFIKPTNITSFNDFNQSSYVMSRWTTGVVQETDVRTTNMYQISEDAINYTQAFGLKFERSMCSAMTYDYYKYMDMKLKEEAKEIKDMTKIQRYQDKIGYFESLLKPECDRLNGEKGEIIFNDSYFLPFKDDKTNGDVKNVVYIETKPIRKNPSMYGAFNEICLVDSIIDHFAEEGSTYNSTLIENVIAFKNMDSTSLDKTKCLLNSSSLQDKDCLEDNIVYEYCNAGSNDCERRFNLSKNKFEYVKKIDCEALLEDIKTNLNNDSSQDYVIASNYEKIRACYKGGFNMSGTVYKKDGTGPEHSCHCQYEKNMKSYNRDLFKTRKITARELGFCVNLEDAPTCPAVKYFDSNGKYVDNKLALGKTENDYQEAKKNGDTSIYTQHFWRTDELQFGYIPSVFFSTSLGNAEFDKSNYCSNDGEEYINKIEESCNPIKFNKINCENYLKQFFISYNIQDETQKQNITNKCNGKKANEYSNCMRDLKTIDAIYANDMCIGGNKIVYGSCNGYWKINDSGAKPQAICSKYIHQNKYTDKNGNKVVGNIKTIYEYKLINNPCVRYRCEGIGYYDNGKEKALDEKEAIKKTSTLFTDEEIDSYTQSVIIKDFNIPYVDEETDVSKVDKRGSSNGFAIWREITSNDFAIETTAESCLTGYAPRNSNYENNINLNYSGEGIENYKNNYVANYELIVDSNSYNITAKDSSFTKIINLEKYKSAYMTNTISGEHTRMNLPKRYCDQMGNWMTVDDIYNNSNIPKDIMYYYRHNDFWEKKTGELIDSEYDGNGKYCERLICKKIDKDYINNENIYSKEYLNIGEDENNLIDKTKYWNHSGGAVWDSVGAPRNSSNMLNITGMFDKVSTNMRYIFSNEENSLIRSEYKYLKRFNEGICYNDYGYFNRGTQFQGDRTFESQISILSGLTNNSVITPQQTPMIIDGIKTITPERTCDSNGTWGAVSNNCFRACEMLDIYRTTVSPEIMEHNLEKRYIENHDIKSVKIDKYDANTEQEEKEAKFNAYKLRSNQKLQGLNTANLDKVGEYFGDFVTGGATWPRTIVTTDAKRENDGRKLRYIEVEGVCDASYERQDNEVTQYRNSIDSHNKAIRPKRRCYEDGVWGPVYDNTQCALAKSCIELKITLKNLYQLIVAYRENKSLLEMNNVLAKDITYDRERITNVSCPNIDMINGIKGINECGVSHSLVKNGSIAESTSEEKNEFLNNSWEMAKNTFVCNTTGQINSFQTGWNIQSRQIDNYFIPKTCNAQNVSDDINVVSTFNDGKKARRAYIELYPTNLSYAKETNLEFISESAKNDKNKTYTGHNYLDETINTSVQDRSGRSILIGSKQYNSFQINNYCDNNLFYNKMDNAVSNTKYYSKNIVLECRMNGNDPKYFLFKKDNTITDGTAISEDNAKYIITDFDECLPMTCGGNIYQKNATLSHVKEFTTQKYGTYNNYNLPTSDESSITCDEDGYAFIVDAKSADGKYDTTKVEYYEVNGDDTIGRTNHFIKKFKGLTCKATKAEKNKINGQVISGGNVTYTGTYYDYQRYGELETNSLPRRFCKDLDKKNSCETLTMEEILNDKNKFKEKYCVFIGCRMDKLKVVMNGNNIQSVEIPEWNASGEFFSLNSSGSELISNGKHYSKLDSVHILESYTGDFNDVYQNYSVRQHTNFPTKPNGCIKLFRNIYVGSCGTYKTYAFYKNIFDECPNYIGRYWNPRCDMYFDRNFLGCQTNICQKIKGYTNIHGEGISGLICGDNRDVYYEGSSPYTFIDNFIGNYSADKKTNIIECFSYLTDYDDSIKLNNNNLQISYNQDYLSNQQKYEDFYSAIESARQYNKNNASVIENRAKSYIFDNWIYPFFETGTNDNIWDNELLKKLTIKKKEKRNDIHNAIFNEIDRLYTEYNTYLITVEIDKPRQQELAGENSGTVEENTSTENGTSTEGIETTGENTSTNSTETTGENTTTATETEATNDSVVATTNENNNTTATEENNEENSVVNNMNRWFVVLWDDGTQTLDDKIELLPTEENLNITNEAIDTFKEFLGDDKTIEDYKIYYTTINGERKYYIEYQNISINETIEVEDESMISETVNPNENSSNENYGNDENSGENEGDSVQNTTTTTHTVTITKNGVVLLSLDMYYDKFVKIYNNEVLANDGNFMKDLKILIGIGSSMFSEVYKYYKKIYGMETFINSNTFDGIDLYDFYWTSYKHIEGSFSLSRDSSDGSIHIEQISKDSYSNDLHIDFNTITKQCIYYVSPKDDETTKNTHTSCSVEIMEDIVKYLNSRYIIFLDDPNDGGAQITRTDKSTCETYYREYINKKNQYNSLPHTAEFNSGLFFALRCKPEGWQVVGKPVCKNRCWGSVAVDYGNGRKMYSCGHTIVKTAIEGLRYTKSVSIPTVRLFEQDGNKSANRGNDNDWALKSTVTFSCKLDNVSVSDNIADNSYSKQYKSKLIENFKEDSDKKDRYAYATMSNTSNVTRYKIYDDDGDEVDDKCDCCLIKKDRVYTSISGYDNKSANITFSGCANGRQNYTYVMCPNGEFKEIQNNRGGLYGATKEKEYHNCGDNNIYEKSTKVQFEIVPDGEYTGTGNAKSCNNGDDKIYSILTF